MSLQQNSTLAAMCKQAGCTGKSMRTKQVVPRRQVVKAGENLTLTHLAINLPLSGRSAAAFRDRVICLKIF